MALGLTAKAEGRYAEHSVLREGNWAKIRVSESGFYQLSDALIKKAGFSNPSQVKIYGYGGALQPEKLTGDYLTATDDLKEVPTCTIGGKRIFYATGPVTWSQQESMKRTRNPYSDYGYYFLTEAEGEPLTTDSATFVSSHYPSNNDYHHLYEVDNYSWFHGGRNLFDKTLFAIGTPQTYTLKATGTDGRISIALTADDSYEATIEVNDSIIATISKKVSLDSYTKADEELYQYELTGILKTENCIRITQTSGGNMRLDYIDLYHESPTPLNLETLPEPEYVYRITNQDHHADPAVDMVIIIPTSQTVLAQAQRLKAHHEETDGLKVTIVPADELFNEFYYTNQITSHDSEDYEHLVDIGFTEQGDHVLMNKYVFEKTMQLFTMNGQPRAFGYHHPIKGATRPPLFVTEISGALDMMILSYVGFEPLPDDRVKLFPASLPPETEYLQWGPCDYLGNQVMVRYDRPGDGKDAFGDGREGYSFLVNGKCVHHSDRLPEKPVFLTLKPGRNKLIRDLKQPSK